MGDAPTPIGPNDWVAERLAEIDQVANASKKVEALLDLEAELLPSGSAVLQEALEAALAIKDDPGAKAKALSGIAPHLPQPQQHDVLQQALEAAESIADPAAKAYALSEIAPRLPESEQKGLLERALAAADTIQDDYYKAQSLSKIAPRLPESEQKGLLERALATADTIQDDYYKAQALSEIAPRLPKTDKALLEQALAAADTIQHDFDKAIALSAIAPRLPESEQKAVLEQALVAADNLYADQDKAETLSAIAPHLSKSEMALLKHALTAADNLQNDHYKAQALSAIALRLPESEQKAVLERALAAIDNLYADEDKAEALSAIAPRLLETDKALLEQALAAADNLQDDFYRAEALGAIASRLPEANKALLEWALAAVDTIQGDSAKALALSQIGPRLPKTNKALLERALAAADNLQDDSAKAEVLSAIAPRLPKTDKALLERALAAADNLQDDSAKAQALGAIALCLPETEQKAVLERALAAVDNLQYDSDKAYALSAIVPRLPKTDKALLGRALAAADTIRDETDKAYALSAIVLRLPEGKALLERALAAVDTIQDKADKAHDLSAIALRLPETEQEIVLERALAAADNLQHDTDKAKALGAIAPQISSRKLKRFLEATYSLSDAAESLASPATRLTKDFLQLYPNHKHSTALNIVKHIPNGADKTKFLSALIPRLAEGLLPNALRLIQEIFTSDRYRTETLNNLVPYLPADQTPEALDLITQFIKNPYYKTAALVELIPLLPIECCDEVLNLLEAKIALPQQRASILQAIAKALTTPEQIDKLTSVTSKAYSDVAPTDEDFLSEYQHLAERTLTLTYQLKEPKRDDFSYERAASSIFSQLAPVLKHLAEPEQTIVLAAVKSLKDPGYQAAVLIALAPHFKYFVQTFFATYTGDDYRNLLRIKIQLAITDSPNPQDLRPIADQLNADQTPYIKSPYRNAEAWVEVASHPAGKIYQTKSLRAIQEIQNNAYLQTQYLQRLIPYLQYQQRFEAANIIHDISDKYQQAAARVALARKFPESEFFNPARDGALALESKVQQLEQLSTLAIDMPELLPRIIKLAETADTPKNIDRYSILAALAPHLPMRINREVKRTWCLSNTITDDLWERALYLLARGYRDALQGGTLRNDAAQDQDLLDLKDEINALSGLLLMRDLEPPMTVGILGGWGGGKSYIMHLMQAQMTAIRSRKVDPEVEAWNPNPNHEKLSPYVGHIYQIKFDAWTFAKSDLWASLMQTIFFELNRQISLEQELQVFFEKQGIDPYAANSSYAGIWQALYKASDEDRTYFLQQALNLEDLDQLKQGEDVQNRLNTTENLLWSKFGETKEQSLATLQAKRFELKNTEAELFDKQKTLEQQKLDLEADYQRSQQEFAQQFRKIPKKKLEEVIQNTLGVSGLVLKKRLGPAAFADLQQQIIQQLPNDVDIDNLQTFGTELREAVAKVLESSEEEASFQFSWAAIRQWISKNLTFLLIFGLFALASIAMPILVARLNPSALVPQIVAFITPLLPTLAMAQKLWRSAQKWHDQARQALDDYEKQIATDSQRYVERETQEWLKQQQTQDRQTTIADLEQAVQKLKTDKQQLQTTIQEIEKELPENLPASLSDYITNRIQAGTYDKQLGLMHQVKQDLTDLSRRLLPPPMGSITTKEFEQRMQDLKKIFPRGPARVVVYIDDLDRCPPDRVVQVLEAVQLLVKTPLFIAVLAIDERYITRALEQFYKGVLLRHGSPSGTDYLEKIIQLPYRVRPIMADNLETYLRSQVVIQDNATGGSKFSEFSRQEFKMLLACCKQVDLSPRTLKRLTNVYKLFKIVCRTRGNKPNVQVQQAILALLALSGRYPNLMRGIFEAIETCFEEQRDEAAAKTIDARAVANSQANDYKVEHPTLHLQSPLKDFFKNYQLPDYDRYLQLEFDKLQHDALSTDILPSTLTLAAMTHEIFNLIRSFSFVGEIGEDAKDYRFSGTAEPI
ncbi:MAG: hypothetical protein DCF32_09605 [Leptolyngbya sp.]|nr:MAG: hypothetical protein DCF32_09605 [Leptolyngbya sp.]